MRITCLFLSLLVLLCGFFVAGASKTQRTLYRFLLQKVGYVRIGTQKHNNNNINGRINAINTQKFNELLRSQGATITTPANVQNTG